MRFKNNVLKKSALLVAIMLFLSNTTYAVKPGSGVVEDGTPAVTSSAKHNTISFKKIFLKGYCGTASNQKKVRYKLNIDNGHLVIFGNGSVGVLPDYIKEKIKTVEFREGIVGLSKGSFSFCKKIKVLHIPSNIKSISDEVFMGCTSLKKLTLPADVKIEGENTFLGNSSLSCVELEEDGTIISRANILPQKRITISLTQEITPERKEIAKRRIFGGMPYAKRAITIRTVKKIT